MDAKLSSISEGFAQSLANTFIDILEEKVTHQVGALVHSKLQELNIDQIVKGKVFEEIQPLMKDAIFQAIKTQLTGVTPNFQHGSIDGRAIDLTTFLATGNNIVGGVIKKFQSTGIQDSATTCQVTVLDQATVVENNLITKNLEVKGSAVIDGDLLVTGGTNTDSPFFKTIVEYATYEVSKLITPDFFAQYRDEMFDKIEQEGLHVKELTVNGKEIVSGNRLGYFVTESNLQSLGELQQLVVVGETLMFNTLYVGNKRVGINTMEPSAALTVWDEECEIVAGKKKQDVAAIGAPRSHTLVVGVGNKDNITMESNGETRIKHLLAENVRIGSASDAPTSKGKKGTVLFNENPDIGKPLGWVCLGNSRWVEFGKIG